MKLLEASLRTPVLEAGHIDKNESFFQKRKIFLRNVRDVISFLLRERERFVNVTAFRI